jgi:hypothetical protein
MNRLQQLEEHHGGWTTLQTRISKEFYILGYFPSWRSA